MSLAEAILRENDSRRVVKEVDDDNKDDNNLDVEKEVSSIERGE